MTFSIDLLQRQIRAAAPELPDARVAPIAEALYPKMVAAEITEGRSEEFVGQLAAESGGFTRVRESLDYSPSGLLNTWPTRFSEQSARQFGRGSQTPADQTKIAQIVYGGRGGNVNPGDGWNFRGRGWIQTTFRDNYQELADATGLDCVRNPDLLCTDEGAATAAVFYWTKRKINEAADRDDDAAVTKKINGGLIGLDKRVARTNAARKAK